MISSRQNNRNNLEKLNLERRVDQFVEAGRQFVDGVSGARPGTRRSTSIKELSRRKVNNVTEWVSKKVDSIFEDEDNYVGFIVSSLGKTTNYHNNKKHVKFITTEFNKLVIIPEVSNKAI